MENIVSPSNATDVLNREGGPSNTVSKSIIEDSKQLGTTQSPERRANEIKDDFISNNFQNDFSKEIAPPVALVILLALVQLH